MLLSTHNSLISKLVRIHFLRQSGTTCAFDCDIRADKIYSLSVQLGKQTGASMRNFRQVFVESIILIIA